MSSTFSSIKYQNARQRKSVLRVIFVITISVSGLALGKMLQQDGGYI